MARIDVSSLLVDPDFTDTIVLIRRTITVNQWGETEVTEDTGTSIIAVVQADVSENLDFEPAGAKLMDFIKVYYRGRLIVQTSLGNAYSDIVVYDGRRYQIQDVRENFMNTGRGWTMALCQLETASG